MSPIKEQLVYIKQNLPFSRVFVYYGRTWLSDDTHQFSCDLHGDGRDSKPSARYYADTKLVKCYACEDGNNGGDVTWYIKKREGFRTYQQVVDFVKEKFGVSLDCTDLSTRIKLNNILRDTTQDSMRSILKKQVSAEINDLFFDLTKTSDQSVRSRIQAAQQLVFDELKKAENCPGPYVDFANAISLWRKWAIDVLNAIRV